jgi:alkanesulfonate monooxygenase SsuD/methylene tetrahydromethanopterin reductase-like flavin-dependent oxidoreductase (luciferase family)
MMEGIRLMKALWSGKPVDWDGRWHVEQGVLGPTPHQAGGPPIWGGGMAPAALERAARHFDGWFPTGPDAKGWGDQWRRVQALAREAGRDPSAIEAAIYLTLSIDENTERANQRLHNFLRAYYGPRDLTKQLRGAFAGPASAAAEWLNGYVQEGVQYFVLRFTGDHERHMDTVVKIREKLDAQLRSRNEVTDRR